MPRRTTVATRTAKATKATPTVAGQIDNFLSGDRFTSHIFNRAIATAAMQERSDEVMASAVQSIKQTKELGSNALYSIDHIISMTKRAPDAVALALLERKDLAKIYKEAGYRILHIFTRSGDDVFEKFLRLVPNAIVQDDYVGQDLRKRFVKMKTNTLPKDLLEDINAKLLRSLKKKKGQHDSFRTDVPILVYLSKTGQEGVDLFAERYAQCVDVLMDTKTQSYYHKDYTYALIKAIKDVRNKELRRTFIRTMLAKKSDVFNKILLKYYPKYTSYVSMA